MEFGATARSRAACQAGEAALTHGGLDQRLTRLVRLLR